MPNAYLYLLLRNDLDSMGGEGGKAVAHGAHAANLFTHDFINDSRQEYRADYQEWLASAGGFGTTITLSVTKRELQTAVKIAQMMSFPASECRDPTYPYVIHREYADLIMHPEDHPPERLENDMMLCFRSEVTAAYVFGRKGDLQPILKHFPLMP